MFVLVYVCVPMLVLFPLFVFLHLQYCVGVCLCMHVFSVWLCKAGESRELSKVVALVSSASGLCGRWNQPDCTRGKKKPPLKALEELKFTTKIQEVCLRFITASLYHQTRYIRALHPLEQEQSMPGFPPDALLRETVCLLRSCLTSPSHLMHCAYPARSLLGLR